MNIQVDRTQSLDKPIDYNFGKSNQSFLELSKEDPKKYLAISSRVANDQMVAEVIAASYMYMPKDIRIAKKTLTACTECHYNHNAVKLKFSHIKISFPPEEKMDNIKMKHIALDTLKGLNYVDTEYLIFRHYDEPHPHLHIITPTINIHGSTVASKFEGIRSKYLERELESKYSLIKKSERIKEFKGTKGKSWKEVQLVGKSKEESFSNVIRRNLTVYSNKKPSSVEGFVRALSRDGLRLKFERFEREWAGEKRIRYGVSYGLERSKINFQFSDNVNFLKKEYAGFKMPEGAEDIIKGKKKTTFIAVNDKGEKLDVVISRNHFNGIYLTNEDIIHPQLPNTEFDTKKGKSLIPAIKGSNVGSKYSFYGLQEYIGFSNKDVERYIDNGNDNIIIESPEMTKLLHSAVRGYKEGIKEALDEGAKIDAIEPIDWEFLSPQLQEQLTLTASQHLSKGENKLSKDNFKADLALAIYQEDYIEPNKATIDLARAFEKKDWESFYKSIDAENEMLADTRVIPDIKWVTDRDDVRNYIKATFERRNEFINDLAKNKPQIAKKEDRATYQATLSLAMALENKDREKTIDLITTENINYQEINLGTNNTQWLDRQTNEFLFYRASNNNIEEANSKLLLHGYTKIGEQTAREIEEKTSFEGRYIVKTDIQKPLKDKDIDRKL